MMDGARWWDSVLQRGEENGAAAAAMAFPPAADVVGRLRRAQLKQ